MNFPNLTIFVGKKNGKNSAILRKNVENLKTYQKIRITNFKEKRLHLFGKDFKIIIIISKLNTSAVLISNLFEIYLVFFLRSL